MESIIILSWNNQHQHPLNKKLSKGRTLNPTEGVSTCCVRIYKITKNKWELIRSGKVIVIKRKNKIKSTSIGNNQIKWRTVVHKE